MSLIAQLLRPAPPLPPVCHPGRHGATYRHSPLVEQDNTEAAAHPVKKTNVTQDRCEAKRIEALKAVMRGASSVREIADAMKIKPSAAYEYSLWLERERLCVIDRGKRPYNIRQVNK